MIMNALYRLIWSIFVQGPLQLIGSFNNVLNYLTGGVVGDLMFGSKQEFSFQNIPMAFWYFVITALCLFSLIFTITMIKILFQDATEAKTKFIVALQNGSKAFVFIFLIPIFFFLANFAIANIAKMITSGFGGENGNIANYLYNIGNKYWDGSGDNIPSNYAYPDNIGDFNMIAEVFGVWFMLFAMFMIGIALVQKIIELFFLFIISPWVMVAMTIDNGKGAFIWKDMVIAKFLASTATLTGYFIFMTTIQTILSTNLAGLGIEGYGKSLFIILMMCGGGLAVLAFSDVVANLIGEAAGIREGMNSMRSTVAGGMMALGAAKMAGKAFGFAKSKRAKRAMAMGGSSMGEKTMNAMGSMAGDDGDGETSDNQSRQEKPLDFRHFWHATEGMSSRAGITGLAGFGLGVATLATSKLVGAARGGGAKGFWKQFGTGIATPFVATYKKINPQLASKGNQENKRNTIKSTKLRKKSLNKKLEKVRGNLNVKPITNPQTKKEIRLNKKISINENNNDNGFVFINPQNKMQQEHNKNIKKSVNYQTKQKNFETKITNKIDNFGEKQKYLNKKQDIKTNIKDLSKTKNIANRVNIHNFKNDLKNAKKDFKSKTKNKK
ncbi:Mbov_0396 family ICE element transmembrane protein [Spiroplasma endosymbiont of Dromius quadrimaculatus]|uniref:Mbov_0396 family ICE element transmembrane protein n=3 Tax=unclassified Spiroplasma TaxID=2637901 RepID=UPI00313AF458